MSDSVDWVALLDSGINGVIVSRHVLKEQAVSFTRLRLQQLLGLSFREVTPGSGRRERPISGQRRRRDRALIGQCRRALQAAQRCYRCATVVAVRRLVRDACRRGRFTLS